jgi:hypothetical protein
MPKASSSITTFLTHRIMNKLINLFAEKQKTLFLIDSIGAFLTAFFLFVIRVQFNEYFGMPETVLTYLSVIAICFCIYSAACFLFLKEHLSIFIRLIGIANLLYCALTIGLLFRHNPSLTILGTIYFIIEIVIICILSYIELKVAARNK